MTTIQSALITYATSGINLPQASGSQSSQQDSSTSGSGFGADFLLSISDTALSALGGDSSQCSSSSSDALTYSGSASNSQNSSSSFEILMASITGSDPSQSTDDSSDSSASADGSSNVGDINQLFAYLEQMLTNAENTLGNIGSDSSTTTQASSTTNNVNMFGQDSGDDTSYAETALANGGPLPVFLKQVDASMNLNSTQQQALQNIANENMNATNSTASIDTIATELQQAGI